ncbi:hypothetical protein EGW08_004309 [Elysia chlorotica]|uniref:Uncharacterized protein n=1 Tax=Elysia chlorotica TaxID=188477 RepID=A0A3S1BNQ2_ELYCH|nr:hypothetical protein EGW08_004309 [Elysia chlorotica]
MPQVERGRGYSAIQSPAWWYLCTGQSCCHCRRTRPKIKRRTYAKATSVSVTKLRSGELLVECCSEAQVKRLGKIDTFVNIPVTVKAHRSLNSSRGVQARAAAIFVELDPNFKRLTYATSVGTKIAQTAPQGAKSHKTDYPVKKAAESKMKVKPRASPAPQRAPLETFNRFMALTDNGGIEVADVPPISPSSKAAPSQRSLPPSPSPSSSLATIFGDILPDSPVKPSLPPSNPPSPKLKKAPAPYPFTPEVTVERRDTGKKPAGLAGQLP